MNHIPALAILAFSAALFGSNGANANIKICGQRSADSMTGFSDSISEYNANGSKTIGIGITELASFPELQTFLETVHAKSACISAIAIGKNIYQYQQIFATIYTIDENSQTAELPIIFQTASIQAIENLGKKPWLGFDVGVLNSELKKSLANVGFKTQTQSLPSPADYLDQIFPAKNLPVDSQSRSFIYLAGFETGWKTYLVSQLRMLETNNPFTSSYFTEVGIVQIDEAAGIVKTGVLPGYFDLFGKLQDLQSTTGPSRRSPVTPDEMQSKLRAISHL